MVMGDGEVARRKVGVLSVDNGRRDRRQVAGNEPSGALAIFGLGPDGAPPLGSDVVKDAAALDRVALRGTEQRETLGSDQSVRLVVADHRIGGELGTLPVDARAIDRVPLEDEQPGRGVVVRGRSAISGRFVSREP